MPGLSEPSWWYAPGSTWQSTLLSPISTVVGWTASARLQNKNVYRSRLPVICVGNFTAGGSGKTPLSRLIAHVVSETGHSPWFLSRGYGGKLAGPIRVDPANHTAADVGDEPLLLARDAATVVARDRKRGAEFIEGLAGPRAVIVMDDGLQNPSLAKDLAIAAMDGVRGLGNGHVIPSGPLRAPLQVQIGLADLIVVTGQDGRSKSSAVAALSRQSTAPIVSATTQAVATPNEWHNRRVLAYAGIANPGRFFAMLENIGATIVERRTFGDHHVFTDTEARQLLDAARVTSSSLVTTEKDLVRIAPRSDALAALKQKSRTLAIECTISETELPMVRALVAKAIAR